MKTASNNKVSVHILYNPERNIHQTNINKLKDRLLKSKYVSVDVVAGESGHIGRSRMNGFMRAREKYCCYVDDDDIVVDFDYFERVVRWMDSNPSTSIYAGRELVVNSDKDIRESEPFASDFLSPTELHKIHHLQVYRTEDIRKYQNYLLRCRSAPEIALNARMVLDGYTVKVENNINYVWNKAVGETHVKSGENIFNEHKSLNNEFLSRFGFSLF